MKKLALTALLLVLSVAPARAEEVWRHGIAMHGAPAYPADFAHLSYVDPAAPRGGTLTLSAIGGFDSVNRYALRGSKAEGLHLTMDSLMARVWDEPFSLYGLVAEAVRLPEDRRWIEFRLDARAKFHDGSPVRLEDIRFTFEKLRDEGPPNTRTQYGRVAEVAITGEDTIRFTFGEDRDRELPLIMAMMPVLSEADWQGRELDGSRLDQPPLTTGPYRIEDVSAGERIIYRRQPDYWAEDHPLTVGQFNPERIIYDYYRDDAVALEAFRAGEIDIRREWDAMRWASRYDFPAVEAGDVVLEALPHGRPDWMRALIPNSRRAPFDDRRVRQALGLALDFEWMNRTLFAGLYRRIESYYPNSALAAKGVPDADELALLEPWRDSVPEAVFGPAWQAPRTDGSGAAGQRRNLREADRLLREAGWMVRGGVRVNAAGTPLGFEILLNDPADERLALVWAQSLDRLGISVSVRSVDSAEYLGRMEQFEFDVTLGRWISTLSPGNEQLFYWGSAAAEQPGSRNYAGIRSEAVDALAGAIAEAQSRAGLETAAHALDRVLTHGAWSIPLYYLGRDLVARWRHVGRPETIPVYGMVLEAWWVIESP